MSSSSILVWDREEAPPAGSGEVLLWREYAGASDSSVPRFLEDNARRVRTRYLSFIHDMGEARVDGRSVIEHLALHDGFSLWWMTLVVEKNPYKSPRVYDCLRLLALEEILRNRKPAKLALAGSDQDLARSMETLCRRLGIRFVRRAGENSGSQRPKPGALRLLPSPVRGALAFLRRAASRPKFPRDRAPRWFSGDDAVFFCSYFALLDAASCARGVFRSRQWGTLPGLLRGAGRRLNWLQHYIPGPEAPDAATGSGWLDRFNARPDEQGVHAILESYWTPLVALRALKIWLRLNGAARRLRGLESAGPPEAAWLWPLLRDDWNESVTGPAAVRNCLWIELFDSALKDLPPQPVGLYLCENLSWEYAFLRAWRAHGHGRIVGTTHTTMPYWHLYNLNDPRTWRSTGRSAMPMPDLLAVNGPAARGVMTEAGFPAERLADVEALRYLDLPRFDVRPAADPERARIIVLGDSSPAGTRSLLALVAATAPLLPAGWRFTLKPHPLHPVRAADFPGLNEFGETDAPLGGIIGRFDIAVAANGTSAAVDAHEAGLPVVVGLDGNSLNLSSLRGLPGARFAGTPEELAAELRRAAGARPARPAESDFFFLDPELPRWRRLLSVLIR